MAFSPAFQQGAFQLNAFQVFQLNATDFVDYIFKFPDQGSWQRDPVVQAFAPSINGSQPGVQLLIYNPVETLQPPIPPVPSNLTGGNTLVGLPQLANSTVALPGFWGMLSIQGTTVPPSFGNLLLEDKKSALLLEGGGGHLNLEGSGKTPIGVFAALAAHANIQLINDRTLMFAQKPSVVATKLDVSHINIIINSFGVYVRDGLLLLPGVSGSK